MQFTSGAALLTVEADKAEELKQKLPGIGRELKTRRVTRCFSFKIYDIPAGYEEPDFIDIIKSTANINPSKVVLLKYNREET